MKTMIRTGMGLIVLAAVMMGCSKAEEPTVDEVKDAAPVENWEPESVDMPEGHSADDGHDHSGHDHEDHSGHNH